MADLFEKNELILFVIYHKKKKMYYRGGEKVFFGTNNVNDAKFYKSEALAMYAINKLAANTYSGKYTVDDYCLVKYKAAVEEILDATETALNL